MHRRRVRGWSMSSVERVYLGEGGSVILKSAAESFAGEPAFLDHAALHGVPVPRLFASLRTADRGMAMLMEDLGDPIREADLADAATAAVAVHRCPSRSGRPVLDVDALTGLPVRALAWLEDLKSVGRWLEADDIRVSLERVAELATRRAKDADIPPYGMCHSEFHPTSLHLGEGGMRILDWARAYTGPGLLDLVFWQGTPDPLDIRKVSDLINAYVDAGGTTEAKATRASLPPHRWAGGWAKMWNVEWFMESAVRYQTSGHNDHRDQQGIRRDLAEVLECLT